MESKSFRLDMTMMYAAHDAFRRELGRLVRLTASQGDDPQRLLSAAAGWETFKTYLRVHHTSEDDGLWPVMRLALLDRQDDSALLETLQAEHGAIDPLLEAIDEALADRDAGPGRLGDLVDTLATRLSGHLIHEEREGLPLIDRTVSEEEWRSFSELHRQRIGSHMSRYLPWLLDGATADKTASILSRLPEAARRAYLQEWQAAYADLDLWGFGRKAGGN